ncbi:MAG TPA: tetratricopeptide repeat protein, partial [Bacteroidota bacterium]|nr:tetratricopeptide repeat protein [Bacteroidota bacterium]
LLYNAQKTEFARQVDIFSYLVRRNPNDFLSLYYKGDALYRQQYQDSGMVFIQQSADLNPRYFPSIISVAHYKNAEKDTAGALAWYLRAESIRPRDKDLLYYIGECYRKLGSLDTAVCYFKQSLAIDSANAIAHAQLGYAYYSKGKFDSSIASYDRAIANDDDNIQYYLNLALAYEKIDSTQKVIQTYKRLIGALHPKNLAIAWQYLASLYSRKEMLREAADAYQHVYDFNPDNSMALLTAADHYERAGNYKAALELFEKLYRMPVDAFLKSDAEKFIKSRINALKKKMQ